MIDIADQDAPRVQAVQGVRPLEHRLRRAGHRRGEEAPECRIHGEDLVLRQVNAHGLPELRHRDLLQLARLGPLEHLAQDRGAADKMPLDFALPGSTSFGPVELVLVLQGQLLVEDAPILEVDRSKRPFEIEWKFCRPLRPLVTAGCGYRRWWSCSVPGIAAAAAAAACSSSSTSFERCDLLHELGHANAVARAIAADNLRDYPAEVAAAARCAAAGRCEAMRSWRRSSSEARARARARAERCRRRRCCCVDSTAEGRCESEPSDWRGAAAARSTPGIFTAAGTSTSTSTSALDHHVPHDVLDDALEHVDPLVLGRRDVVEPFRLLAGGLEAAGRLLKTSSVLGRGLLQVEDEVAQLRGEGHRHGGLRGCLALEFLHQFADLTHLGVDEVLNRLTFLGALAVEVLHVALELRGVPLHGRDLLPERLCRRLSRRHPHCEELARAVVEELLQLVLDEALRLCGQLVPHRIDLLPHRVVHLGRLRLEVHTLLVLALDGASHHSESLGDLLQEVVIHLLLPLERHQAPLDVGALGHHHLVVLDLHLLDR